jgi:hypothetical protein
MKNGRLSVGFAEDNGTARLYMKKIEHGLAILKNLSRIVGGF